MALLFLADSVPPSAPSWLWLGAMTVIATLGGPVAKGIWSAASWITKKDAPSVTAALHDHKLDAHSAAMNAHETADAARHAEVKVWIEDARASSARIEGAIRDVRERVVRVETQLEERTGGPREPTGSHRSVRG